MRVYLPAIAILLVVAGTVVRLFFPPHHDLMRDIPEGNYTAQELFHEFTADPARAYIRLANKVVIVEGEVAGTGDGYALIGKDGSRIRCIFRHTIYDHKTELNLKERVTIKGVCRGMDMTELLVTHCILLKGGAE